MKKFCLIFFALMLFGYVSAEKSVKAPPPPVQNAVSVIIQSVQTCQQAPNWTFAVDLSATFALSSDVKADVSSQNQKSEVSGNPSAILEVSRAKEYNSFTVIINVSDATEQDAMLSQQTIMEGSAIKKSISVSNQSNMTSVMEPGIPMTTNVART